MMALVTGRERACTGMAYLEAMLWAPSTVLNYYNLHPSCNSPAGLATGL